MFLIDKVVLGDENGEVVRDALAVIVRVDSDGDHLGLLGLQQLIVRLDVVLPTPGIELALPGPDDGPVVRGLAFIPEEMRDSVPGYYQTSTRLVHSMLIMVPVFVALIYSFVLSTTLLLLESSDSAG